MPNPDVTQPQALRVTSDESLASKQLRQAIAAKNQGGDGAYSFYYAGNIKTAVEMGGLSLAELTQAIDCIVDTRNPLDNNELRCIDTIGRAYVAHPNFIPPTNKIDSNFKKILDKLSADTSYLEGKQGTHTVYYPLNESSTGSDHKATLHRLSALYGNEIIGNNNHLISNDACHHEIAERITALEHKITTHKTLSANCSFADFAKFGGTTSIEPSLSVNFVEGFSFFTSVGTSSHQNLSGKYIDPLNAQYIDESNGTLYRIAPKDYTPVTGFPMLYEGPSTADRGNAKRAFYDERQKSPNTVEAFALEYALETLAAKNNIPYREEKDEILKTLNVYLRRKEALIAEQVSYNAQEKSVADLAEEVEQAKTAYEEQYSKGSLLQKGLWRRDPKNTPLYKEYATKEKGHVAAQEDLQRKNEELQERLTAYKDSWTIHCGRQNRVTELLSDANSFPPEEVTNLMQEYYYAAKGVTQFMRTIQKSQNEIKQLNEVQRTIIALEKQTGIDAFTYSSTCTIAAADPELIVAFITRQHQAVTAEAKRIADTANKFKEFLIPEYLRLYDANGKSPKGTNEFQEFKPAFLEAWTNSIVGDGAVRDAVFGDNPELFYKLIGTGLPDPS